MSAASAAAGGGDGDAFWTACPHCCYVHSYSRAYLGRRLRCPTPACRRPFSADELPSPPPIVPGADMYYCAWAFFPLGPPSAAADGWAPFTPFNPAPSPAAATPAREAPTSRRKVGVCLKGRARVEAEEEEAAAEAEAEAAAAAAYLEVPLDATAEAEVLSGGLGEKGDFDIGINETVELSELGFRVDEIEFLTRMQ